MNEYFIAQEEDALPELTFQEPDGFEIVGWWCWRSGGHCCDQACKSDSVPLMAQTGWAKGVRANFIEQYG